MIKEVFELKANSWHTKLNKWIFDIDYRDFRNMCPYFWITVLSALLSPFILFVKVLITIIKYLSEKTGLVFKKWEKYCEKRKETWLEKQMNYLLDLTDKDDEYVIKKVKENPELSQIFEYYADPDFCPLEMTKKSYILFSNLNYFQRDFLNKKATIFREKLESEKQRQEEIKRQAIIAKNQKIAKIAKYSKYLVIALGVILSLICLYGLYIVVMWIADLNWNIIFSYIWTGIQFIGTLTLLSVSFYLISRIISYSFKWLICRYGAYCVPCENRRKAIESFFKLLFVPFIWVRKSSVTLWEILVAIKNNNCPGIEWKE